MIKRVGRYEIVASLGRGGFGQVFSAVDPAVNRMVAVKLLTIDSDPSALTRFRNEATASGRLRHPNIVTIYDFDEQEDGTPFIVMELVEGQDLQHVISDRMALEPYQRLEILAGIASGLGYAHSQGIIHRDVKPANVMLLPDGSVKIMDFGIALITQAANTRLTKSGYILGTFRYMAPEQYRGNNPDSRSDIFAFGLVAYEFLTGVHPFQATEPAALMYNVMHVDAAPVRELWPACPPSLEGVIQRLLERDQDLRYQTLEDFVFDLQPTLTELRRGKAFELFEAAQSAENNGTLEVAQHLVRQALGLDPAYPGARDMRERVQQELRRQEFRPRVQAALREGREKMSTGQLQAALERFESAARLDPTDRELLGLISEARLALELKHKVTDLVDSANKALRNGDFAGARKVSLEALALSPAETAARRLLERADAGLEEDRLRALLEARIERARQLAELGAWEEAETFLREARAEFPGANELRLLAIQVAATRAEMARKQRLSEELSQARRSFDAGNWDSAEHRLESLCGEFPESTEARELLQRARKAIERRSAEESIASSLNSAREHAAQRRYKEARQELEKALAVYPAEPRLLEEIKAVAGAQAEAQRRAALDQALEAARRLRMESKYDEALQALERVRASFGGDAAVEQLAQEITQERDAVRHAEQKAELLRQANERFRAGDMEGTVTLLQPASEFLADSEVREVLQTAEARLASQRQREVAYQQGFNAVVALETKGRLGAALEALTALDQRFEVRPAAAALRTRLEAERERRRAAEFWDLVKVIQDLMREGKPEEAARLLEECPAYLRGSPELDRLGKTVAAAVHERANRERATQSAVAEATKLIARKEWAKAGQVVEEYRKAFGDDPALSPLRAQIETALAAKAEADLDELASLIAEQMAAGDLEGAQALLRGVPSGKREAPRFAQLAASLAQALEARRIDRAVEACLREVAALQGQKLWDTALQKLDDTLRVCPGNEKLHAARQDVLLLQEIDQREQARRELLARIDQWIGACQWDEAARALSNALRERPKDADLAARKQTIDEKLREREQTKREMAEALDRVDRRMGGNPDEAIRLLGELCERWGQLPELVRRIETARAAQRQAELQALTANVYQRCDVGDFDGALALLQNSAFQGPEIDSAKRDVTDRRAAAQEERIAAALAAAKARISDQPEQAQAILIPLQREFPGRKDVNAALRASEKAIRKAATATGAVSSSEPANRRIIVLACLSAALVMAAGVWLFKPAAKEQAPAVRTERVDTPATTPTPIEKESNAAPPTQALPSQEKKRAPESRGRLIADLGVPGIGVSIDGQAVGVTGRDGRITIDTTVGIHTVEVADPRFQSVGERIQVSERTTARLPISLRPVPAPKPAENSATKGTPPPVQQPKQQDAPPTPAIASSQQTISRTPEPTPPPPVSNQTPLTPTPRPVEPPPSSAAADAAEIRNLLAAFGASVQQKDLAQIERMWPSSVQLATWRRLFPDKDYKVTYVIEPRSNPEIDGIHASVRAYKTEITVARFAKPLATSRDVTVELIKSNGRWVISAVR